MSTARLIYAASGHDADLLYATHFYADDPFLWWEVRGQSYMALSPLEIDRAQADEQVTRRVEVQATEIYLPTKSKDRSAAALIVAVAEKFQVKKFIVPENFPAGLLEKVRAKKIALQVSDKPFFPLRFVKSEVEITALTEAVRVAEVGMRRGWEVLRASQPNRQGVLKWGAGILTSERLRVEIDSAVLHAGGIPANTIVAGGEQGCDPHERGHGPLRANEAIVLDIFPRHARSHYFGDLTRTVVKGHASEALKKQYAAVQKTKRWVLENIRAGVEGKAIQDQVIAQFKEAGFPTEKREGRWVGMFHGVGHGLGLDLHEAPRFAAGQLYPGLCVTIEPGLYYPGVGGVRLEDVAIVTETGARNLTKIEERLELR